MKFTQEDVQATLEEIPQYLRCLEVEHVRDNHFNINAKFWLEDDFQNARDIGLAINGVSPHYLGKSKDNLDMWGIQVEVEYIGKHRIVMG